MNEESMDCNQKKNACYSDSALTEARVGYLR